MESISIFTNNKQEEIDQIEWEIEQLNKRLLELKKEK